MATFNSALVSGDYDKLRGAGGVTPSYMASQFISFCPNTTVFAARVNQASFTASFAQVTYDTVTVGAHTDIQVGQTVYISHTNDIRAAHFVGRVRKTPTSSLLYINETSADVTDNDYIFVIHDFRVWDKLAREVSNVQFKDYEVAFRQLPPVIYNLKSAYVGIVSGSPSGFTQRFQPSALAATQGATISSYAFTITSGMTVVAGSASSNDVTIRFDAGHYWLKLVVTDSGGRTATRWIPVWSVPSDMSSQVALSFTGSQITGELSNGFNASIEAFEGIEGIYDNTFAVIWDIERYNGAETNIVGNVRFVGRLRNETSTTQTDENYSDIQTTAYELEGPGAQLGRINMPNLALRYDTTPTVWDEINNLTPWRAIVHVLHEHSTFLDLHSLEFDSTANTFLAQLMGTQGENILAVVQDLAQSINAALEFAPDGRAEVVRDLRYESTANRNAATVVADFGTQDYSALRLTVDHVDTVGRSDADGGTLNAAQPNAPVTPLLAIAPGVAQNTAEGRSPLPRQVLTANVTQNSAQAELNTRVGHHFAAVNPTDTLVITHLDGYHFLIPSLRQWYTWTLDATTNLPQRIYTTSQRWLLTRVSVSHDNDTGTKTVEATYTLETVGTDGQSVTYPPPGVISTPTSSIPPFDAYGGAWPELPLTDITYPPPFTGNPYQPPVVAPSNGNTLMIWTATQLWLTKNFISTAYPTWNEITPPIGASDSFKQARFSEHISNAAYVLVTTPTHSVVYYTSDVFVSAPDWVTGTQLGGLYKLLRLTNESGKLFVCNPDTSSGTSNTLDDPLTSALGPQTHVISVSFPYGHPDDPTNGGVYQAGGGRTGGGCVGSTVIRGGTVNGALAVIDLGGTFTLTAASFWYINDNSGQSHTDLIYLYDSAGVLITGVSSHSGSLNSWRQNAWTGSVANVRYVTFYSDGNVSQSNTSRIDDLSVTYTNVADKANIGYSADNGATWASVQEVGASPGSHGGFDTVKLGDQSLAAKDTRVAVATTLGGAYANYGNVVPTSGDPTCIVVPRYDFGSTTSPNSNTATPEYLVGSDTSSGNQYISKVTASGVTFTDITPSISGDFGKAVSGNCMAMPFKSGNRIAAILDFDGVRHLVVSTNAGGAWSDRGAVEDDADFITYRKGDGLFIQLFFADGVEGPAYSGNHGATIAHKSYPSTDPLVGIAVYG